MTLRGSHLKGASRPAPLRPLTLLAAPPQGYGDDDTHCTRVLSGHLTSGQIISGATLVNTLRRVTPGGYLAPLSTVDLLLFDVLMDPLVGKERADHTPAHPSLVAVDDPVRQILFPVRTGPGSYLTIRISDGDTVLYELSYANQSDVDAEARIRCEVAPGTTVGIVDSFVYFVEMGTQGTWTVGEVNQLTLSAGIEPYWTTEPAPEIDWVEYSYLSMTAHFLDGERETVAVQQVESIKGSLANAPDPVAALAELSTGRILAQKTGPADDGTGHLQYLVSCQADGVRFAPLEANPQRAVRGIHFDMVAYSIANNGTVRRAVNVIDLPSVVDSYTAPMNGDSIIGPLVRTDPPQRLYGLAMCVVLDPLLPPAPA